MRTRKVFLPAKVDSQALDASQERPGQFLTLAEAHESLRGRPPSPRSRACAEHQYDGFYSCLVCYPWRKP